MTCLSGSGGEAASGGSVVGSSRDLDRHVSVEEAEQHWRGELEQMRRELDTLKESLKDQVDSEEVRLISVHELFVMCTCVRHVGIVVVWQETSAVGVVRRATVVGFVSTSTGVDIN